MYFEEGWKGNDSEGKSQEERGEKKNLSPVLVCTIHNYSSVIFFCTHKGPFHNGSIAKGQTSLGRPTPHRSC